MPARAFIDVHRPETLGALCGRAQSISVFRVTRFNKEKGVIFFEKVKDLKGKFPRDTLRQVVGAANSEAERKRLADWMEEGRQVIIFRYENRQAISTGNQYSVCDAGAPTDEKELWSIVTRTEPFYLQSYCGDIETLLAAVAQILDGKEVVVSCMVGSRDDELRLRTGKMIKMNASLRRMDYNPKRDTVKTDTADK